MTKVERRSFPAKETRLAGPIDATTLSWIKYHQQSMVLLRQQIDAATLNNGRVYFVPLEKDPTTLILTETAPQHAGLKGSYDGVRQFVIQQTKQIPFAPGVRVPQTPYTGYDMATNRILPMNGGETLGLGFLRDQGIGEMPALANIGYTHKTENGKNFITGTLLWVNPALKITAIAIGPVEKD